LLVVSVVGSAMPAPVPIAQAQTQLTFDCATVTEIPHSECEALVAGLVAPAAAQKLRAGK
jgi:hypothetical protein